MWTKQLLLRSIAICVAVMVVVGCIDQDPFGFNRKSLVGSYSLERAEDGSYRVVVPGQEDGGGVLEGTVEELAWSSDVILARRRATFRGDPDGWMVIEVATGVIRGPLSGDEVRADPKLAKMAPEDPTNVWKR
jgi:hypothetical protein